MKTHTKTTKMKGSRIATVLAAAFLAASLILPMWRGESPIELGLDLAGGTIVTYRPDFDSLESAGDVDRAEILALAKETLTSRLYRSLDTVPDVVVRGDQRIVVSLPSRDGDHRVLELMGGTYRLSLRLVTGELAPGADSGEGGPTPGAFEYQGRRLRLAEAELTGDMLDPRAIRVDHGFHDLRELPQSTVQFQFQPPHDKAFAELTRANVGRELAILIDDEVEWVGRIDSAIDGPGVLRGGYGPEEANHVAGMLRSGAMPVSLEVESLTAVGPDLGEEVQDLGWRALGGSLALLAALVAVAYLHRGSLLLAGLTSLACLLFLIAGLVATFDLTLDLAGIAGLVLSLGMGMDAFILIFEAHEARPRDGDRRGWAIRRLYSLAGEGGTLLHANLTTLIVISLLLGSERLKSFAIFICVGVVASVATIFFTRRVLRWSHGRLGALGPDLLAWLRRRRPGVFRWRRAYFALTAGVLAAGLLLAPPLELGADFRAGTQLIVSSSDEQQVSAAVDDLRSRFPEVDVRRQTLGAPEDGRFLITVGAPLGLGQEANPKDSVLGALALDDSDRRRLGSKQVLSIFAAHSLEVESVSSIDGKLSSRRMFGSLAVLGLSFLLLAVYFVACQEPLERALSARRRAALPAAARLTIFAGVLAAVIVDVSIVLAVAALLEIPISLPVIAGLLTILGYSVNDSVVLWENVRRRWSERRDDRVPAEVVTVTADAVLSRALLTSASTLVPALVILAVGLTPLADFARVMIAGVISGTLSSIFIVGAFAARALERRPARLAPAPRSLLSSSS